MAPRSGATTTAGVSDIRDVVDEAARWRAEGARVALARVVAIEGSGPREPGATMAVHEDGRVAGSVSGGCVEGAVVEEALRALGDGATRFVEFGYSDTEAFAVGLTCGGVIGIFIAPELPAVFDELAAALRDVQPVALTTVVRVVRLDQAVLPDGESAAVPELPEEPGEPGRVIAPGASLLVHGDGRTSGTLGHPSLDRSVRRDALGALSQGRTAVRTYGRSGEARDLEVEVFLDAFTSPPKMVIFGAVDFTVALTKVAKLLGYVVTVCDARAAFATSARLPLADEVVVDWPGRYLEEHGDELGPRDAVCVLTHDPKFDIPAIVAAVRTNVGYIGAMGSRRTQDERLAQLARAGLGVEDLNRVMAPIGLDIGARAPEEVAVAICAEIIALQTGHGGPFLRDGSGPIHERPRAAADPS